MFGIHTPATTLSGHVALDSLFSFSIFRFASAASRSPMNRFAFFRLFFFFPHLPSRHLDEIHSASIDTPESRFTSCFEYQKDFSKNVNESRTKMNFLRRRSATGRRVDIFRFSVDMPSTGNRVREPLITLNYLSLLWKLDRTSVQEIWIDFVSSLVSLNDKTNFSMERLLSKFEERVALNELRFFEYQQLPTRRAKKQ